MNKVTKVTGGGGAEGPSFLNKVTKVTGGGGGVSRAVIAGRNAQRGDRDCGGKNHIG
jgi:hypothetical protein